MIFFSVLLLLTLPLYLGSIATTSTLQNGDTASRSLSRSFAMILTAALWTVLATLIFAAYLEGGLSTASAILAVLLVPSSAVIAIIKINRTRSKAGERAPVFHCATVPVLLAAFVCWTKFNPVENEAADWTIGGLVWLSVLAVSLGTWLSQESEANTAKCHTDAGTSHSFPAATLPTASANRENNRRAFFALSPHVSLQKWLPFISPQNELREEALRAIRQSPRRQADAEFLLKSGSLSLWREMSALDLKLTPTLADLGRKFIRERARDISPLHPKDAPNFEYMDSRIEPYLAAMTWLVEQHCDCRSELQTLIAAVKLYPESEKRNSFLRKLSSLRAPAVTLSRPPFSASRTYSVESST